MTIQEEINRVTVLCHQYWANKSALNRYKFGLYSSVLAKVNHLFCQKKTNSKEFRTLYKELKGFE